MERSGTALFGLARVSGIGAARHGHISFIRASEVNLEEFLCAPCCLTEGPSEEFFLLECVVFLFCVRFLSFRQGISYRAPLGIIDNLSSRLVSRSSPLESRDSSGGARGP